MSCCPASFPFYHSCCLSLERIVFRVVHDFDQSVCSICAHCRHYFGLYVVPHLPSSSLTFAFVELLLMYSLRSFFFFFVFLEHWRTTMECLFLHGFSVVVGIIVICFVISFAVLFSFVQSLCFIVITIVSSVVICGVRARVCVSELKNDFDDPRIEY